MRVCVFGTRGFPEIQGGVEMHCENLYPEMPEDIKLEVCRRLPYVTSDRQYSNIEFVDIPCSEKRGLEAAIHSLRSAFYCIKHRPDVVHIHNIGPAMYAPLLKLFGLKVVLTYHSPNYEHDKWNFVEKLVLKISEHLALNYSDKIIFINKPQMEKFSDKIRKKSIYMPIGVKSPSQTKDTSFLEEIGVEKGKYILGVGRITPEKGFDVLIKAYNIAKTEGCKLVIAGGVEFEDKYKKELDKIIDTKEVIFPGFVYGEKLAQLYRNASLFVLSSYNEGFPLVLLEAMSYNLKILVSDIPATHLIELDGNCYFEKGNYTELATEIERSLTDDAIPEYDLSEYSWTKIAKDVADIYRELI